MSVSFAKGDVVVVIANNKHIPVKITSVNNNKGILITKHQFTDPDKSIIAFEPKNIVANLGQNPRHGKVYNQTIEPVLFFDNSEHYGNIYYYAPYEEKTKQKIVKRLTVVAKNLKHQGIFPTKDFDVLIRPNTSKIAGWYKNNKKPNIRDELCLCINEVDNNFYYFAYHEMAHGIWFNNMDDSQKSMWVKAYQRNTSLTKINDNKIISMREDLVKTGIGEYKRGLDAEDREILSHILKYIKRTAYLKAKHIDMLIQSGDDLLDIWPESSIDIPFQNILISDYANTAVEELFAESFAFFMVPGEKEIPKSINKLLQKTILAISNKGKNDG